MGSKNLMIGIIALIVFAGLGFYFISNQTATPKPSPESNTTVETQPPVVDQTNEATDTGTSQGEVKEFTVTSNGLSFNPKEIKVKMGDRVRITYKNNIGTHNWTLDEFNVQTKMLNATQEETVEFVASKAGTFEYYCSVPGHRQDGMKGSFIVE